MSGAQAPSCATIIQCVPAKDGMVSVTHSTGRSERSSWIAANSGCTSAHSSCSHSLHAWRSPQSPGARRGSGCRASQASGARKVGSSASSSKRIVVPERAGPVTIIGATIFSLAISGRSSSSRVEKRRVRRPRSSSWRVISRPTTCMFEASSAAARSVKRVRQRGSPKSPDGTLPPSERSISSSSAAPSMGTMRRASPPTESAIALRRRTQSGRR